MTTPSSSISPAITKVMMDMNRTQGRVSSRYCCASGVRPTMTALSSVAPILNSVSGTWSVGSSLIGYSLRNDVLSFVHHIRLKTRRSLAVTLAPLDADDISWQSVGLVACCLLYTSPSPRD